MEFIENILLTDRLITPAQSRELKELGIIQVSYFAFSDKDELIYEPGLPMTYFDWATQPGYSAAFDESDLTFILGTFGYYICGRTWFSEGFEIDDEYTWWCDTTTNVCELTADSPYVVYGKTPAEAKGNMLIKAIKEGLPAINWPLYYQERMSNMHPGLNKRPKHNEL